MIVLDKMTLILNGFSLGRAGLAHGVNYYKEHNFDLKVYSYILLISILT